MVRSRTAALPPGHLSRAPDLLHDRAPADETLASALALQSSAGNRAVTQLLGESDGRPLDSSTRNEVEPALGADLSSVRVHVGAAAAEAAATLNARAFTVGSDIAFAPGAFDPATDRGRQLLAHELAHVVQQRNAPAQDPVLSQQGDAFEAHADSVAATVANGAGGPASHVAGSPVPGAQPGGAVPAVQRQAKDAPMPRDAEAEVDEMVAAMYNVFYNDPTTTDTTVLIAQAGMLFDLLVEILDRDAVAAAQSSQAKRYRPLVRIAATHALLHIGQELARRAARAAHASDGALLTDQFAETVPWTAQRPRRLSDITSPGGKPIFTDANIQMWTVAMLKTPSILLPPAGKGAAGGARKPKAAARAEAPKADPAAVEAPMRAMMLGADAQEQDKTATEEDTPAMIGPEVAAGLAKLKGATIGDALEAIRKRMTDVSQPGEQPAKAFPTPGDKLSLLQVCGRVIFLGNRIYRLDRTGHIAAGDFAILPKWMSFKKGGVYFLAPFRVGTEVSK